MTCKEVGVVMADDGQRREGEPAADPGGGRRALALAERCRREPSTVPPLDPAVAWRDDVALQLWVDTGPGGAFLRLAGTLDRATGGAVLSTVAGLLAEGYRYLDVETDGVDSSGAEGAEGIETLLALQELVQHAGGQLVIWRGGSPR